MWTSFLSRIVIFQHLFWLYQAAPSDFYVNQFYPVKDSDFTRSEVKACGTIRDVIRRGTARFRKVLVRNDNGDIIFRNDDSRYMTSRAKSKLDVLAARVISTWGGNNRLSVEKAWTDNVDTSSQLTRLSLHYEGRAIKVKVRSGNHEDTSKLSRLCGLAVDSGFDFVHYYRNNEIHISVKPDVCQTNVDLAFILDASGSVGYYNYEKCKEFLKNLVDFYSVGRTGSRIALIRYASYVTTMFKLNRFYTKHEIKQSITSTGYTRGGTATGNALLKLKNNVFTTANGMRDDKTIPKIGILLTDGRSNQGHSVSDAARQLRQRGVNMFSIGIGSNLNMYELRDVATDPDSTHVFRLDGFDNLSEFVDQMSTVACDEGAQVSQCESAETLVESGSFKYFRGQFGSDTNKVTIEVEDLIGKSYLYVSLTNKNPGPLDDVSTKKSETPASPRVITQPLSNTKHSLPVSSKFPVQEDYFAEDEDRYSDSTGLAVPVMKRGLCWSSARGGQLVYISVQGQEDQNKFKINIWNALFSSDKYTVSVPENVGARHIKKVTAQVHGTFRYSISHGNQDSAFRIDQTSGDVYTTKQLDRERISKYTLVIKAEDVNQKCHQGRTSIEVIVNDQNDNSPRFTRNPFVVNIREDSWIGQHVVKLTATDADTGTNAKLSYTIDGNAVGKDKFHVNSQSGDITLAKELDYDAQPGGYQFPVKVTDGGGKSSTATLKINIIDVNEAPFFTNPCVRTIPGCSFSTQEEKTAGQSVATMAASDPDKTQSCLLRFSIISSDNVYFSIGETNGQIKTRDKINRELKENYRLTVRVRDCANPPLTASTVVRVTATDINDNKPLFPVNQYLASVQENQGRIHFLTVYATDADKGKNAEITWSITGGNTNNLFEIGSTGDMVVRSSLDREAVNQHTLTVQAKDGGASPLTSTVQVIVNVLDVNDNKPEFTGTKSFSVFENVTSGENVGSISTKDKDQGLNGQVRCNIVSGNYGLAFSVDPSSCQLKTSGLIDREARSTYALQIEATDLGRPVQRTRSQFTVTVKDVNDNTPVFTKSLYTSTVKENAASSTQIIQVTAQDRDENDNAKITYSITSGDDSVKKFGIDGNTGQIKLIGILDFGTRHLYELSVEAKDGGSPPRKSTATVRITIEDTNDFNPVFNPSTYTATIPENVNSNTNVKTITATDNDSGPSGQLTYSIINGNVANSFKINSRTGQIQTTKPLDYEARQTYILIVQAKDNGKPSKTGSARVTVNIQDQNDNKPVFDKNPYRLTLSESASTDYEIGQVRATDRDSGQNAALSYLTDTTGIPITITSDGKVKVTGSLDRETKDIYQLTAKVKDGGSPARESTSQVIVTVLDANDNAPIITNSPIKTEVLENSPSSTLAVFIVASDADIGNNAKLSYSLSPASGSNFPFRIESDTGKIVTTNAATLDRETVPEYSGTVTVTDAGNPPKSTSTSITITIKDENDNKPIFNNTRYSFNIQEEQTTNLFIGTAHATDKDTGNNAKLRFAIVTGNIGNRFTINQDTGRIDVKNKLDRETIAKFTLRVRVSDNGIPSHTTEVSVDINVEDVNDNTPILGQSYSSSIREDAALGSNVVQVRATDADEGTNAAVTYLITGGANKDSFNIDSKTGQITTKTKLDYEVINSYQLDVVAEDGGTPKRRTQPVKVNIQVINVDDNAPQFGNVSLVKISEGVGMDTTVVTLKATDADGSSLNYTIDSGNIGNVFKIDSAKGEIRTRSLLDRESNAYYNLTVKVTDSSGKETKTTLPIKILDVNDNKPVFVKNLYEGKIKENGVQGQAVAVDQGTAALKVNATDRDEGPNAEIQYLIVSGSVGDAFTLDATTGALTTKKSLDRESTDFYNLVIAAQDKGVPPLRSTVNLQVRVLDQNDNRPSFSQAAYTTQILENSGPDFDVIDIDASDPDQGTNGDVSVSILSENGASPQNFKIVKRRGDVSRLFVQTSKNLDREQRSFYHLRLQASDGAQPPKKAVTDVNITVVDENDNSPTIISPTKLNPVTEGINPGPEIATFRGEDKDAGINAQVTFTIVSGNEGSEFILNSDTGVLKLAKKLDREVKGQYNIKVKIQDKGTPSYRSFTDYILNVTDVNDNAPKFLKDKYTDSVNENATIGTSILTVTAIDSDIGISAIINYKIKSASSFPLKIDATTGEITTSGRLDYETKKKYDITVIANDGKFNTEVPVTINVININDNSPKFVLSKYTGSISESKTPGSVVLTVNATDLDPFGKLLYSSTNGTNVFSIDPQTGEVKTSVNLDRETKDKYVIQVKVSDGGSPQLTATAIVEIKVDDANDNAPLFKNPPSSFNISENKPQDTLVGNVIAEDEDIGVNRQIEYQLKTRMGNFGFRIDPSSGNIFTTKKLDRESITTYILEIIAKDKGNPPLESLTLTVSVNVQDDNDNNPSFLQNPYNGSVSEGANNGSDVIEVKAKDADIGRNGEVIYSILEGNIGNKFEINSITGVVSVAAKLDRETVAQYIMKIQASDKGSSPRNSTTNLNIKITDINDFSPVFDQLTSASVPENEPPNTLVITVKATDKDIGENARLKYSLKTNDAFTIHPTLGEIRTKKMLDREDTDHYDLELTVTDHGNPPLSNNKTLRVDVTDKDDNCPVFSRKVYNVTIKENLARGTIILNVTATDLDLGVNARPEYAIKQADDRGAFAIDSVTGSISVAKSRMVDYEYHQVYHLIIRAGKDDCGLKAENATNVGEGGRDRYNNQSRASVFVKVIDINDNPPSLAKSYHVNFQKVQETKIIDLQAKDPDTGKGGIVEYRKIGTRRLIKPANGLVHQEIDVMAYDQGVESLNTTTTINVHNKIRCDAMSFSVLKNGSVRVSTLCSFVKTPVKETKLLVDERLELECEAAGNTNVSYSWSKDGKNFADWSPKGKLVVPSVSQDEEGRFECRANNAAGSLQSQPAIVLVYEKPKIITHPKDAAANLKGTALFTCEATGDPAPTYQWYRNDRVFDAGIGARTKTLTLEDLGEYDEGTYHCVAENEKGKATSYKAELKVFDPSTVVEIKATINKPNEKKTCHYFTKDDFEKLMSKSVGQSVSVTKIDTSKLCPPSPCGPNPCLNDGKCEVVNKTAFCSCKDSWTGDRCEKDVNECTNPQGRCQNNGTCINKEGYYTCDCLSDWTGRLCQLRKDACKPNPCKVDKKCVTVTAAINSSGHSCVAKSKEMTVTIKGLQGASGLTPEMRIKLLAQLKAMMQSVGSKPARRFRRDTSSTPTGDLSSCEPQITGVGVDNDGNVKVNWVIVCPDNVKENAIKNVTPEGMCNNLLNTTTDIKSCGSTGKPLTTAAPEKTFPPLNISVEVVIKDKKTGKAFSSKESIDLTMKMDATSKLWKEGISVLKIKQAYKSTPPSGEKQSKTKAGVIAGAVCGVVGLMVVGVVVLTVVSRNRKSDGKIMSVQERGAMRRKQSTEDLLRADISMSNINTMGLNGPATPDMKPKMEPFDSRRDTYAPQQETFMFTVPDKIKKDSKPSDSVS